MTCKAGIESINGSSSCTHLCTPGIERLLFSRNAVLNHLLSDRPQPLLHPFQLSAHLLREQHRLLRLKQSFFNCYFLHIVLILLQVHKLHKCEFICNWYVVVPCVYSSLKPVCGAPAPSLQRWWCPAGGALSPLASEPPAAVHPPKRKRKITSYVLSSCKCGEQEPTHMWRISVLCCILKFKFGKLRPAKS